VRETAELHTREQEHEWAVRLGFRDYDHLDRARRFSALPAEGEQQALFDLERRHGLDMPSQQSPEPERRADRVGAKAAIAPERNTRVAERWAAVRIDTVKAAAAAYLEAQYTNSDGI